MSHPSKIPPAIQLPILADLLARGDGTFILKPHLPASDLDTWIPVKAASKLIGVSVTEMYGLLDTSEPYLVSRRPARWKILVSLKSVRAFTAATANPAFWTDAGKTLRNNLIAACRAAQAALASPAN
jgi:hypothetical protein